MWPGPETWSQNPRTRVPRAKLYIQISQNWSAWYLVVQGSLRGTNLPALAFLMITLHIFLYYKQFWAIRYFSKRGKGSHPYFWGRIFPSWTSSWFSISRPSNLGAFFILILPSSEEGVHLFRCVGSSSFFLRRLLPSSLQDKHFYSHWHGQNLLAC